MAIKRKVNTLFIEKYRPTSLDTYISDQAFKDRIQSYIDANDIPHLLFSGNAGVGKTAIAKILVDKIKCDVLWINASKENNVDTVRNRIHGFATSLGINDLKIVVLDECDFQSLSAQASLRGVMESSSMNTRFILTCNYPERMMDAIISRCQHIKIYPPSKKEVAAHMMTIMDTESKEYELEDLKFMIDSYYPDIRKILGELQSWSTTGKLVVDKSAMAENDYRLKLMEIFKSTDSSNKKLTAMRQLIANAGVREFSDMFRIIYDNIDKLFPKSIPESITVLNKGQYYDSLVLDKEINAIDTLKTLLSLE